MQSRDRKPFMESEKRLRGLLVSKRITFRRQRPKTIAALKPAGPPPITITSYISLKNSHSLNGIQKFSATFLGKNLPVFKSPECKKPRLKQPGLYFFHLNR